MRHIKEKSEGTTEKTVIAPNKEIEITTFTMKSSDKREATIGNHIEELYRVRVILNGKMTEAWVGKNSISNPKLKERLIKDLFNRLEHKK